MPSDSPPVLPPELEREIFESAAALHSETIPNLLLVSQRIREWIERLKYKTVADGDFPSVTCGSRGLLRAIRSDSKPTSFFRDHVQNLFIQRLSDEEQEEILSICSRVQFLVLFERFKRIPSLRTTQPCRLSLYLNNLEVDINSAALANPMFTCVTHLDLFDLVHPDETIATLASLPALTHLGLWNGSTEPAGALVKCGRLQTLVNMYNYVPPSDEPQPTDDVRYVCMAISDDAYLEDWIIATQGGLDFWARADAFIAKKRRGEIKPSSRCWIEEGDGIA